MTTFEYELIKMDPVDTDVDTVQEILNDRGAHGYRYIAVQKFWTRDSDYQAIQRNFLVLEKKEEEEL
jgi:uncharacterized membrane protein